MLCLRPKPNNFIFMQKMKYIYIYIYIYIDKENDVLKRGAKKVTQGIHNLYTHCQKGPKQEEDIENRKGSNSLNKSLTNKKK